MTIVDSRAVAVVERTEVVIAQKDLDMYRAHFCPDAPDNEWLIFQQKCMLLGLNPMLNEVYLVGRNTKVKQDGQDKWVKQFATQVSITGLIALAERTRRYEGPTQAEYYDKDLTAYPVWPLSKGAYPYAIRIGVYKQGWREASYAVTYFHERAQYYGDKLSKQWQAQGIHMLYKCALAAALRWAFQETCGGVYIHEEMGTADIQASDISIIPNVDTSNQNTNEALRETAKKQFTNPAPVNVSTKPATSTKTEPTAENKKLDEIPTYSQLLQKANRLKIAWKDVLAGTFAKTIEKATDQEAALERLINAGNTIGPNYCQRIDAFLKEKEASQKPAA